MDVDKREISVGIPTGSMADLLSFIRAAIKHNMIISPAPCGTPRLLHRI